MADFNTSTAHEELIKHALDNTTETGITNENKEKLHKALEEKEGTTLKVKIETKEELARLKIIMHTQLKKEKLDAEVGATPDLTEQEITNIAQNIITESSKSEEEQLKNDALKNTPDETPTPTETAPENTTPEESIDLLNGGVLRQVPESYQKEVKNHIVNNGGFAGMVMKGISNWITEIIKGIKGFFATFGIEDEGEKKDALAQINGFEDAEEERRVTSSVKALKSSPITKGPPLSDILKISHISNEELTQILKDNPGLDFSSTKNIEAAFTGKYTHSGDRGPMLRYDRIFLKLKYIHDNIDPSEPYNATNKFKEILAGSTDNNLVPEDQADPTNSPPVIVPAGGPTEEENTGPISPEAQKDLLTQAKDLDTALSKSKIMPEGTPDEKNQKTEAIKNAEENLKKFQEDRKNTIVGEYTDITNRIRDTQTTITMLENRKSPDEKKQLEDAQEELVRLQKIEQDMKTQIDAIMTQNNDRWEINPDISAEKMTTTEIALSAIENNTAIIETQDLTEEEKKQKEAEKIRKIQEVTDAKAKLKDNNQVIDQKNTSGNTSIEKYKLDSKESLEGAKKILEKYQNDADITSSEAYKKLSENVKFSEAKKELVKAAITSIGTKTLAWGNEAYRTTESGYDFDGDDIDDTDDSDDGWVEIEDGKIGFDEDWDTDEIELNCDQKVIDALKGNIQSGIWIARNIIIENKDNIMNRKMPE